MNARHEVEEKIRTGVYKLVMHRMRKSPIWKMFATILKEDATVLDGLVYCIECKKLLKFEGRRTSNLNRHSCFVASTLKEAGGSEEEKDESALEFIEDESSLRFEMDFREEVEAKMKSGAYKLIRRTNGKSPIWSLYARISKEDGAVLEGWVYCRQCKNLFKYNGRSSSNLNRHKCYIELQQTPPAKRPRLEDNEDEKLSPLNEDFVRSTVSSVEEEIGMDIVQKNVDRKIRSGFYKLTANRRATSSLWSVFSYISKEDGSIMEGLVCCRQCNMILKYDDRNVANLNAHKCATNTTTLDEVEEDQEFIDEYSMSEFGDCLSNRARETNEEIEPVQGAIYACLSSSMDFCPTLSTVAESQNALLNAVEQETEHPYNSCVKEEPEYHYPSYVKEETEPPSTICVKEEITDTYPSLVHEKHASSSPKPTTDVDPQFEEMRHDVEGNIKAGLYKLQDKQNVRSSIWKMFALITREDGSLVESWVCCRLCKKLLKNNDKRSSNLSRHPCYATTLKKINEKDKEEVISACSTWIIEDCRPVSLLEGSGFRKMVNYFIQLGAKYGENLDINDLVPESTTLAQSIRQRAEEEKNQVTKKIQQIAPHNSVSVDLWPDNITQRNYLSASLHFSRNFEMFDLVLGLKSMDFKNTNTQTIRHKLENLLSQFGMDKLHNLVFVTDKRQTNVEKALADCTRLNCSSYLFANVLDSALEKTTEELSEILRACKVIVKYFKNSVDQTSLKTPGTTRCTTPYGLIKSIAQNWENISVLLTFEAENQQISEATVASLQSLVELCQKFEFIFKRLQETRLPSLCFVIPSINRLKDMCEATKNDKPEIAALKSNMLKSLEEIWLANINIWHKAAFFLYPPANQEQQSNSEAIKLFCVAQMNELPKTQADTVNSSNLAENSDSAAAPDKDEINFFFPYLRKRSVLAPTENPEEEVERYCRENVRIDDNFDVAQWWRHNTTNYPRLSRLALRILTIPASTTGPERIFPLARNIINEPRSRLTPKNVDRLLFLNSMGHIEL